MDRQRRLQDIQEELERIKQEMEERGSTMTDGCMPTLFFGESHFRIPIKLPQNIPSCICWSVFILSNKAYRI